MRLKSSTLQLYELLPAIEAQGRGAEYRSLLECLSRQETYAEGMEKLRLFAYSLGPTDEIGDSRQRGFGGGFRRKLVATNQRPRLLSQGLNGGDAGVSPRA
jgi:hypothetical protein